MMETKPKTNPKKHVKMGISQEEKEQNELQEWRNSVDSKLTRLLLILENDERIGKKGLVQKVDENTKLLEAIEVRDKIRKGQFYIIASIGGFISSLAFWIVKNLLTHNNN